MPKYGPRPKQFSQAGADPGDAIVAGSGVDPNKVAPSYQEKVGPTGPTGPTGSTGPVGPTGSGANAMGSATHFFGGSVGTGAKDVDVLPGEHSPNALPAHNATVDPTNGWVPCGIVNSATTGRITVLQNGTSISGNTVYVTFSGGGTNFSYSPGVTTTTSQTWSAGNITSTTLMQVRYAQTGGTGTRVAITVKFYDT